MSVKVKICGITNLEDALNAVELGTDALGFIFVKESPRYILPAEAQTIISQLPPFVVKVGVLSNSEVDKISDVINLTNINCLQLHEEVFNNESDKFRLPIIKAIRVARDFDISILQKINASAFLLDTYVEGKLGGTGKTFDWKIAIEAKKYGRVILAGGLNPDNIIEAVERVQPYAVDVNSGVETAPGKKNKEKMSLLFNNLNKKK